ncbi:transposase [Coprobacillaceae bacterium CR2/5/TPMF4]|nr:transposase [Coprobacillaceae bacterium CR2/5/TPMF4]
MLKLSVPLLELMMMSDMFQILSLKTKMDIKILRLSSTDIIRFKNADHYVFYSGSSPHNKCSGKSVEIMDKISKKGLKYLRHALYMIAEFARRHNPVLKHLFKRVKNGKKRHNTGSIAVANCIARYIYSIMKNESSFVIMHENIMRLPEETRNTFFDSISLDFPKNTRKQIYQYSDINGEIHRFIYKKRNG